MKKDRLKPFLTPKLKDFIFNELSDEFLDRAGARDLLHGVPIPMRKELIAGESVTTVSIGRDMAFVIGCDPVFRYRDVYMAYIRRIFSSDFKKALENEGARLAESGDPETACVYFRAALLFSPEDAAAMYGYARACHDAYEKRAEEGGDEEYVGRFKAESMQWFEKLTMAHPDFAPGYYYLGYAYLNMGLYIKAKLTFDEFLRLNEDPEAAAEIRRLDERLKDPCRIEEGTNAILGNRFETGIGILTPYRSDERYNQWWPLWYYLGIAYRGIGESGEAIDCQKTVLRYSPSNRDAMQQLVELYESAGDAANAGKYRSKIRVVEENAEADREEKRKAKNPKPVS